MPGLEIVTLFDHDKAEIGVQFKISKNKKETEVQKVDHIS
jgi:hypothetical protein